MPTWENSRHKFHKFHGDAGHRYAVSRHGFRVQQLGGFLEALPKFSRALVALKSGRLRISIGAIGGMKQRVALVLCLVGFAQYVLPLHEVITLVGLNVSSKKRVSERHKLFERKFANDYMSVGIWIRINQERHGVTKIILKLLKKINDLSKRAAAFIESGVY